MLKVAHSPYFASIDALCSATLSFGEKMDDTDRRVVKVLLSEWSHMMRRVWVSNTSSYDRIANLNTDLG